MENVELHLRRFVKNWWTFSLIGILLIVFGVWTFINRTDADFVGLTTLFIFLFVINGSLEIYFALSNRRVIPSWGEMLSFGVSELLLGLILAAHPPGAIYIFQIYVGFWLLMARRRQRCASSGHPRERYEHFDFGFKTDLAQTHALVGRGLLKKKLFVFLTRFSPSPPIEFSPRRFFGKDCSIRR